MAPIVAFGRLADRCEQFLSKGRQVYVEGRLITPQYEAKDGCGSAAILECSRFLRLEPKRRLKVAVR
jgi:hypothetical protein